VPLLCGNKFRGDALALGLHKLKKGAVALPTLASLQAALVRGEIPSVEDVVIALADQYTPLLLGFCLLWLKDSSNAEEVASSVLFEAGREFEKKHKVPPRAWIIGRAKSRCIDCFRHGSRRVQTSPIEDLLLEPISQDPEMQPEAAAILHALQDAYRQAVMDLPVDQRTAIALRNWGFSTKEIAQGLRIRAAKVRSLQDQGDETIRKVLAQWR
jgi:RNA polymerase sigma factor (sigma-70 family)